MAYELLIGACRKTRDGVVHVGSIEFDELPSISRLLKRVDSSFLARVSNLFEDETFEVAEIEFAMTELLPLLALSLHPEERLFLHKILAVCAYAKWRELRLFCAAD